MGDNISNGQRHVIRVYVEPVELELDEDNALLISSLQSALPGSSGLYYHGECKSSVKFDGKKLLPPADGWQDRKYFATLGARPFDYPFGSYAAASKQFERSVNAVQRLLGNNKAFDYISIEEDTSYAKKKIPAYTFATAAGAEKAENMRQLLSSIAQRQSGPQGSPGDQQQQGLTPIEQQFVDLARISTAKDTIIEQQRTDIKAIQEKLDLKEKALKQAQEELSKAERRCAAQEEELEILRGLSKEQSYMCEKVNNLTKEAVEREKLISQQRKEIDELLKKASEYEDERTASYEKITEQDSALREAKVMLDELESRLEKLKPLADIRQITKDDQILSYVQMVDELKSVRERNEKLENDMKMVDDKYHQLNQIYTEIVAESTQLAARCKEYEDEKVVNEIKLKSANEELRPPDELTKLKNEIDGLRSELSASENRVTELTKMVHTLTREATTSAARAEEAISSRNEMRRSLDLADTKIQITISK